MRGKRKPLSVRGIAVFGLLGALLFVTKLALAALPNIEPVSLLVMVYTVVLGRRALYPIYIYVGLEFLIWGISLWSLTYLYIWAVLALFAWVFRRMESPLGWAVLSGTFGLCFGALSALVYLVVGDWQFALTWWVSGIPFDAVHCIGNFFIALVLFHPCRKVLSNLSKNLACFKTS